MVRQKAASDESAGAEVQHSGERICEFVIALFHGMGLQNRYATLDELVQFMIRSLCSEPDRIMQDGRQIRVSTHTHRERRDRDVVLSLQPSQLHPDIAARLGGRRLVIRCSEVYWAPITSGRAKAWKTILWLLGGLSSVVRAFVTMQRWQRPDKQDEQEAARARGRSRSGEQAGEDRGQAYGQMESLAEVWRLIKLLTRLAVVIIVLPLIVMSLSVVVLGWLAGWAVHLASRLPAIMEINRWWEGLHASVHDVVANPWMLGDSPLLQQSTWLALLAVLLPLLVHYVGTAVLVGSVSTPHSGNDTKRNDRHRRARPAVFSCFLLLLAIAYWLVAGGCHQHWQVLTSQMQASADALGQLPRLHAWAWLALSLPLASLLALLAMMGLRILREGCSWQRLLGFGTGLVLIAMALRGWLAGDSTGAALAVLLILAGTWLALIHRGLLFFREYLGDVAAFVSTNENDDMFRLRREILQFSEEKLEQVLGRDLMPNQLPDRYEASEDVRRRAPNVIVLSHSLGTVVAYQALCRYFERLQELDRIEDLNTLRSGQRRVGMRLAGEMQSRLKLFVTFGSPLDTIGMAFNALHSGKPVFDRVVSNARYLHGSPGVFAHCRWVNWWHHGDVVSAKVLWHAGACVPENRKYPLPSPWVVNHSAYLLSKQVQEDFRREFERLL
ncbi:hypothetical protein KDL29_14680 [bacterium]|nr:hypothetical protein [bacterium]